MKARWGVAPVSASIDRLYEERQIIMDVLGENAIDLLAPAVAWLTMHLVSEERTGGKT